METNDEEREIAETMETGVALGAAFYGEQVAYLTARRDMTPRQRLLDIARSLDAMERVVSQMFEAPFSKSVWSDDLREIATLWNKCPHRVYASTRRDYTGSGHCAEMRCWNYISDCPKHSLTGDALAECSRDRR